MKSESHIMKQKKLPFKNYTIMNNSLIAKFGCADVYRLFILSLTTDRELQTDTTLDQLADFVGEKSSAYKGNNKSKSFTDKLRDSTEVTVESEDGISYKNGNKVTRNTYTFKEPVATKYRRISKTLIDLDLPIKIKGYIIKLFSIAEPHSYKVNKSLNELAGILKMAKTTIKKYNEELINSDLLEVTGAGFTLKVESLIIDDTCKISKKVQEIFDGIEHMILLKNDLKESLSKSEAIYLSAKQKNFKDITNLEGWALWLITGVPFKNEDKKEYTPIILI